MQKSQVRKEKAQKIIDQVSESLARIKINDDFSKTIDTIIDCKGKVVTTGMGKAGIAMQKFTATLCSLGVPSLFLHPGEASHGDLGALSDNDILFVASTSGKTREVIEVVTLSQNLNNIKIIGITSHPDSIIREKADLVLDMGVFEEAGFLSLAPTTSILIMQVLTDSLALIVAEEKGFSKSDFGKLHHSGYLGDLTRQVE